MKSFDASRPEFLPYGLSCVQWKPTLMNRADRHNEIEISYFPKGRITFLIKGQRIEVKENQFLIFWALVPHQIIEISEYSSYFVCTIPFKDFLQWDIQTEMKNFLLDENIMLADGGFNSGVEQQYFTTWIKDLSGEDNEARNCAILEIKARISRIIHDNYKNMEVSTRRQNQTGVNLVERIAVYLAKNYTRNIKISDVGKELGLHPDYANAVFRKAFSVNIKKYLTDQRIMHAQRLLSTTDKKIIEVAYESGFKSLGRFNAEFKAQCQCTPREYKRYWR